MEASMDMFPLAERTAIATGASRDIGEATAKGSGNAGADLVLVSRNRAVLAENRTFLLC